MAEPSCRECGMELNDLNWSPSERKNNSRICKKCVVFKSTQWYQHNRERYSRRTRIPKRETARRKSEQGRIRRQELKQETFNHYSPTGHCVGWDNKGCKFNCTDIRAESLDHIDGKGADERRKLFGKGQGCGTGEVFYKWLRKNNYPEGYQVLCMNCQFIKRVVKKEYSSGRPPIFGEDGVQVLPPYDSSLGIPNHRQWRKEQLLAEKTDAQKLK